MENFYFRDVRSLTFISFDWCQSVLQISSYGIYLCRIGKERSSTAVFRYICQGSTGSLDVSLPYLPGRRGAGCYFLSHSLVCNTDAR